MNTLHQVAAAAALLTATLAAHAAGSLLITPAAATAGPGDSFAVLVQGAGFTDNVVGGGFNLAFDPAVLTLDSVSVDTVVWEFASSNGLPDNTLGTLSDVYFASNRTVLPTGDFAVATLQFTAKTTGSSALLMSASALFPFVNDTVEVIAVSFGTAGVTVSAVPEPQSWALFAAGLVAMGALARRGHRSAGLHADFFRGLADKT